MSIGQVIFVVVLLVAGGLYWLSGAEDRDRREQAELAAAERRKQEIADLDDPAKRDAEIARLISSRITVTDDVVMVRNQIGSVVISDHGVSRSSPWRINCGGSGLEIGFGPTGEDSVTTTLWLRHFDKDRCRSLIPHVAKQLRFVLGER